MLKAAVAAAAAAVTAAPLCALLPHSKTPFFLRLSHRTLCAPPLPQTPPITLRQSRPNSSAPPSSLQLDAAASADVPDTASLSHSFLLLRQPSSMGCRVSVSLERER